MGECHPVPAAGACRGCILQAPTNNAWTVDTSIARSSPNELYAAVSAYWPPLAVSDRRGMDICGTCRQDIPVHLSRHLPKLQRGRPPDVPTLQGKHVLHGHCIRVSAWCHDSCHACMTGKSFSGGVCVTLAGAPAHGSRHPNLDVLLPKCLMRCTMLACTMVAKGFTLSGGAQCGFRLSATKGGQGQVCVALL